MSYAFQSHEGESADRLISTNPVPTNLIRESIDLSGLRVSKGPAEGLDDKPALNNHLPDCWFIDERNNAALPAPDSDAGAQKLNPRFKDMGISDLEKRLGEKTKDASTVEEAKAIFKELIARFDLAFDDKAFENSMPVMDLLCRALKEGKEVEQGADGQPVLSDNKLSADCRWKFHVSVFGDLESMNNQVRVRLEYAQFLKAAKQFADAEKMGIEARDKSERLMKPVEVNGTLVRPVDFMQMESRLLVNDLLEIPNPDRRQSMQQASMFLTGPEFGANKSPINTNKFLAQLYLGTELIPEVNEKGEIVGILDIRFGQSSAFKPQKAFEAAQRARQATMTILNLDPLDPKAAQENPGVASLFGGMLEVLDNPAKYNLYRDDNADGKPDLIEAHEVESLKKQISENSTFSSLLIDVGVMVLGVGAIAVSRNPKVLAAFESSLGRFAFGGKLVPALAITTAAGAGLLVRHYGYNALTGLDEPWMDSLMHVSGSLASAAFLDSVTTRASSWLNPRGSATHALSPKIVENSLIKGAMRPSVIGGSLILGASALSTRSENKRFNDMLRKTQAPIENEPLPKQNDKQQP